MFICCLFSLSMEVRPARSPLFPYTTLFRSGLAMLLVRALVLLGPASIPRLAGLTVDANVLAFTIAAAAVTSDVFGLAPRSEEHTSELQSQSNLVCRLQLEKKNPSSYLASSL